MVQDDGYSLQGRAAQDNMCIGMYGLSSQVKDPHTTVCMRNQNFFLVDKQLSWDWSSQVSKQAKIDAVCGIGYEKANADAQGWLARAIYEREHLKW